ncbi:hypothetical protein DVQ84_01570 [Yersinia enterocolitica]|nr:hypothetical protein [Yersinia enterocolitica]EKN6068369.1 hypothetical protein [Yersinia enterocolitica]EKN6184019.1 hypothetical protein [Yersinia enterocolitica]EKN6190042.1 hypothetical protein [Yersinia enterocolitica]EKN6219915.1 hypothetical protein [Yersinia enterocolitica]
MQGCWLLSLTPVTYLCKLLGTRSLVAYLHAEVTWVYASHSSMSKKPTFPDVGFLFFIFHTENFASLSAI